MSTKNDKYSFIEQCFTTSKNRYYNLNLNQSKKCTTFFSVQSKSKTNNASDNYEEKKKSQLWNKSLKVSTFTPLKEDNDDLKKRWKNGNTLNTKNESILTLNISVYEKPTETVASDLFDNDIEGLKKEKLRSIKTSKQSFTDSVKSQNPFEFPRQQDGNQINESEVMQFSTSQRLLPSQPTSLSQQSVLNEGRITRPQMAPGYDTADMKIEITGPIKRTKPFETDKEDEDIKIVVPGAIISNRTDFMSGHGTFYGDEDIIASVAGSVRQVNKLLTVQPFKSRYSPDVGDVIVGRVVEVQQKRWKVDINSISEGLLALANVSLPGGELRRKSAEDEMRMRMYMEEGDLVVAEVLNVQSDAIQLQARTLRYGKLGQGLLVKVSPSLMKRRKTHFHDLHFGAKIILARNGWVWIEPPSDGQMSATGGYTHSDETVLYETRQVMSRIANCLKILNRSFQPIYETTIIQAYSASMEFQVAELIKPEIMDEIAAEVRTKVAQAED